MRAERRRRLRRAAAVGAKIAWRELRWQAGGFAFGRDVKQVLQRQGGSLGLFLLLL